MRNPHNLFRSRHNIYYMRFPIPLAYHPQGKRTAIKFSLDTHCPRTALQISQSLMYFGQLMMQRLAALDMTFEEILQILRQKFSEALAKRKAQIREQGRLSLDSRSDMFRTMQWADNAIKTGDLFLSLDPQNFIDANNLPIDAGTREYDQLRLEYNRATREYNRELLDFDASFDVFHFDQAVPLPVLPVNDAKPQVKIKDHIAEYLVFHEKANKLKNKTVKEARNMLAVLLEILGEDAGFDVSTLQAHKVRDVLMHLPKHFRVKQDLKAMSIEQLVAMDKDHPLKKDNYLKNASINKYISTFTGLFDWAVKRHYLPANTFKGLILDADSDQTARDPFSREELALIMPEIYNAPKIELYWGSLIARYTGARPEEIAQLHTVDLTEIDGVWCFKFNDDADDKSIKTKAGNRTVPVHSELIRLGLLDYHAATLKAGHNRLLYQFNYSEYGGYSRNLGRWFNNKLLPKLGLKKEGVVFYCLRHSAATEMLHSGALPEKMRSILGHEQEGVTLGVYARKFKPKQLISAIETIGTFQD